MTYNKFATALPSKNVDPKGIFKQAMMSIIMKKYPELSIAGLDAPYKTAKAGFPIPSVENAGPGAAITFGTSKHHDVNYFESANTAKALGIKTFDLAKDFGEVMTNIEVYAKAKRRATPAGCPLTTLLGTRFEVHDDFIIIGTKVIPRYKKVTEFSQEIVITLGRFYNEITIETEIKERTIRLF